MQIEYSGETVRIINSNQQRNRERHLITVSYS